MSHTTSRTHWPWTLQPCLRNSKFGLNFVFEFKRSKSWHDTLARKLKITVGNVVVESGQKQHILLCLLQSCILAQVLIGSTSSWWRIAKSKVAAIQRQTLYWLFYLRNVRFAIFISNYTFYKASDHRVRRKYYERINGITVLPINPCSTSPAPLYGNDQHFIILARFTIKPE